MQGTKLDKSTRFEKRENGFMRERTSQAAIEAERETGPEGRRREAAIPISDPREPTNTEKEVHELTHLPPHQSCEQCIRGRGTENPHKRVTFERAESTLPVIAFDFCFIKTPGIVPGVTADEGATCGHWEHESCTCCWKGCHASLSNSSDVVFDCVVMANPRLWPMVQGSRSFFLSQWCWNEHRDMTVKQNLLNVLSGRSRNRSRCCDWILRAELKLSFWRIHVCGRG